MKKILYGPQENFSIFEDTMVEMTWQEYRLLQIAKRLYYYQ